MINIRYSDTTGCVRLGIAADERRLRKMDRRRCIHAMRRDYVKFISSLLLFGSNGIVAARITQSSDEVVWLRTLIGSVLLVVLCVLGGRRFSCLHDRKATGWLLASGLAMGASWIFLYAAYREVGVGISSLAYYCAPVIVMVLSPLIFHERLTPHKMIGFLIVVAGALLVNAQTIGSGGSAWGMFCGWMSAIMHAIMVIASKKADKVDGLESSTLQLVVSFLTVAVWMILIGEPIHPVAVTEWVWVLTLGLLNTGIGCYLYFSSYGGLSVQTVAILGYLEPLSAVVLSALLLGETMSFLQVVGAALILGGALYGEMAQRFHPDGCSCR